MLHCQPVRQSAPVQFQLRLPNRDKPLHKLPEEVLLILVNSLYKCPALTADITTLWYNHKTDYMKHKNLQKQEHLSDRDGRFADEVRYVSSEGPCVTSTTTSINKDICKIFRGLAYNVDLHNTVHIPLMVFLNHFRITQLYKAFILRFCICSNLYGSYCVML